MGHSNTCRKLSPGFIQIVCVEDVVDVGEAHFVRIVAIKTMVSFFPTSVFQLCNIIFTMIKWYT